MFQVFIRIIGIFLCEYGIFESIGNPIFNLKWIKNNISEFVYLTPIGLLWTAITLFIGLLNYYFRNITFRNIHEHFVILGFGIEAVVTITFWILYYINPRLVVSVEMYEQGVHIPLMKQFAMHLFPILLLTYEFILLNPVVTIEHYFFFALITILYLIFSFLAASIRKVWPYGFLEKLSDLKKVLVFVFLMVIGQISMTILTKTSNFVNLNIS